MKNKRNWITFFCNVSSSKILKFWIMSWIPQKLNYRINFIYVPLPKIKCNKRIIHIILFFSRMTVDSWICENCYNLLHWSGEILKNSSHKVESKVFDMELHNFVEITKKFKTGKKISKVIFLNFPPEFRCFTCSYQGRKIHNFAKIGQFWWVGNFSKISYPFQKNNSFIIALCVRLFFFHNYSTV